MQMQALRAVRIDLGAGNAHEPDAAVRRSLQKCAQGKSFRDFCRKLHADRRIDSRAAVFGSIQRKCMHGILLIGQLYAHRTAQLVFSHQARKGMQKAVARIFHRQKAGIAFPVIYRFAGSRKACLRHTDHTGKGPANDGKRPFGKIPLHIANPCLGRFHPARRYVQFPIHQC